MATSARGHKVMVQVQRIEAALPQIENAIQNKKSHIDLAYLPGIFFTNTLKMQFCFRFAMKAFITIV